MSRSLRPEFVYPSVVLLGAIVLYSWTLAPTVTLVDSGELIVAAHSLGVAHPPGFPLYIMLAHVASLVPLGNVAQRVNFASAIFAALACAVTTFAVSELIKVEIAFAAKRKIRKKGGRLSKKLSISITHPFLTFLPALAVGLLLASSRTLWSYATIAEVYTLNCLLIIAVFWLMFKWRRHIIEDERYLGLKRPTVLPDYDWLLYIAAFAFGIALGVHHVTVVLALPALALLVWKTQGRRFFGSKRLLYAALISVAALVAVYAYLPVAAAHSPIINWGNPRSLTAIWWHLTGRQYQVFLSFDPGIVGHELLGFGRLLLREYGSWWLPVVPILALIGFVQLYKCNRTSFWFLTLVFFADAAYGVSYSIAEDKDAYYLPAFIAIAIAAGFGLRWLTERFLSKLQIATKAIVLAAMIALLLINSVVANWAFDNRRHYFIAHDYVENILGSIELNGLLLTLDWQVASPLFYTQQIEQRRRDAKIVDINLLRRSWYFDYLQRTNPALIARSQDKVDAFLAYLKDWERDPEAYASNAQLTQRIATAFHELIYSFVRNERQVAPVYVTNELLFHAEQQDQEITRWLTKNYQLIPHGLVFKLETDRDFHDPGPLKLQTRGLADGTIKFEPEDVVNQKVLPAYKTMLMNRGRYYSAFGKHELAIDAFKQALALDPNLTLAKQGLNDSLAKLRAAP